MIAPKYVGEPLSILDFDIENRPLAWISQDFVSSEITAIACQTIGKPRSLEVWVLGELYDGEPIEMWRILSGFQARWEAADVVTGHNIRRHDLTRINGMLLELQLPPLGPKLYHDTYKHLKKRAGVSASQESLAGMLNVPSPKVGMGQKAWREANRLLPEGLVKTRARVVGDVKQHIEMRARLIELDWLNPPEVWRP